jgi:hypothetical protein
MTYDPVVNMEIWDFYELSRIGERKKDLWFYVLDFISSKKKIDKIKSLISKYEKANLFLPNVKHWICNYCCFQDTFSEVNMVAEGTLNYRTRDLMSNVQLTVRRVLSLPLGFTYKKYFDEVESPKAKSIYCLSKEQLVTNLNIEVVHDGGFKGGDSQLEDKILILSQHLLFKLPVELKNNIRNILFDVLSKHPNYQVIIKRHPSHIGRVSEEEKWLTDCDLVSSSIPAEELVYKMRPRLIVSVCGSSVFLDDKISRMGIGRIAVGTELLVEEGFAELEPFIKLYKSKGVCLEY